MEKRFALLVGVLLLLLVLHCSGANLKVEDVAKSVSDPEDILASESNSNSSDGKKLVSNGNEVQQVKKGAQQVGESKESVKSNLGKSSSNKKSDSKESVNVGGKKSNKENNENTSDGLKSEEVLPELGNGGNVNPVREEGARREECGSANMCTIEENNLVACLRVPGDDESPHLSLLVQNKGKGTLSVAISAPDFVQLEVTKVQLEEKENQKVDVSVGSGGTTSFIVLEAGNGNCSLDFKDLITHNSRKELDTVSNTSYFNFLTQRPTIAIVVFASLLVLVSAWMCISFRKRRESSSGLKYQKLDDVHLPVLSGEKPELHVNDGWDDTWDDNWGDEEAPHTPSMPLTPSLSGKGLASRRLNKEGWKD